MGCGKTYWAKRLSRTFGIPAFDLDHEIVRIEGKTIATIFTEKGESYFRLKENEVLKSFADRSEFILSTGGGAPCFHNNIDWMNTYGASIWIDASPATIAERVKKEKASRPLIANVPDEALEDFFIQMREKRKPFYSKANHHLTGNFGEADFLKILSLYE